MAGPLQLSIPERFKKGGSVPFRLSGTSGFDTIQIKNAEGDTLKTLGSYLKDNSFKDTIKGTLENVNAGQLKAVGFGDRVNAGGRLVYDRKLVETVSNNAQVLPKLKTNSEGSDTASKGGKIMKYAPYVAGAVGLAGAVYYIFGGGD